MSRVQNKIPTCRNCGAENSFQVDRTTAAGDLTCTVCGTVQEENPIVSEVQFGESSSGAATVQGSMVGSDQARAGYGSRQNAMESREQTLLNGKRKIQKLAIVLKIQPHIADAAGGWFNLALTQNFVQGRRSQNVLATCLYIACRKERTHHMLIDFSSRLQISVYSLGATFLKMVKALTITNLPLADPSLFIQNFVESLNFGDKSKKIARDACKLAQRMSNDWIHEGRRPAGIAGACVLLAARMNNIRRTHSEIVNVAHVAPETLQRRLNEFKKTASGSLTVKEFRQSKAPAPSLPPSYYKNRAIEEKLRKQIEKKELALRRYIELANKHQLIPIELPDILKPKEERERLEKERQEEEKKKKEREDQVRIEELRTRNLDDEKDKEDREGKEQEEEEKKEKEHQKLLEDLKARNMLSEKSKNIDVVDKSKTANSETDDEPEIRRENEEPELPQAPHELEEPIQKNSDALDKAGTANDKNEDQPQVTHQSDSESDDFEDAHDDTFDENAAGIDTASYLNNNIAKEVEEEVQRQLLQEGKDDDEVVVVEVEDKHSKKNKALVDAYKAQDLFFEEQSDSDESLKELFVQDEDSDLVLESETDEEEQMMAQKNEGMTKRLEQIYARSKRREERRRKREMNDEPIEAVQSSEDVAEEGLSKPKDNTKISKPRPRKITQEELEKRVADRKKRSLKKAESREKRAAERAALREKKALLTRADRLKNRMNKIRKAATRLEVQKKRLEEHEKAAKEKASRAAKIEKAEQEKVDAVLQSVLMNHDLTEELLTSELQRIINRQKQNLEGLCYQTPAEKAKAEDFKKQVELDKPRNLVANLPSSKEMLDKVNSDPLLNSSDEDEETRDVELTGEALEQKIRIWTGLNYDYIIEQEKKRLKEEADILTGNTSGTRKKRRIGKSEKNPTDEFGQGIESFGLLDAVNQVGEDGESISAADSARKMISKKPFSKKINYDTLHDLFTHN